MEANIGKPEATAIRRFLAQYLGGYAVWHHRIEHERGGESELFISYGDDSPYKDQRIPVGHRICTYDNTDATRAQCHAGWGHGRATQLTALRAIRAGMHVRCIWLAGDNSENMIQAGWNVDHLVVECYKPHATDSGRWDLAGAYLWDYVCTPADSLARMVRGPKRATEAAA